MADIGIDSISYCFKERKKGCFTLLNAEIKIIKRTDISGMLMIRNTGIKLCQMSNDCSGFIV